MARTVRAASAEVIVVFMVASSSGGSWVWETVIPFRLPRPPRLAWILSAPHLQREIDAREEPGPAQVSFALGGHDATRPRSGSESASAHHAFMNQRIIPRS